MAEIIQDFLLRGGELGYKVDKQDLVGLARDTLENNYFESNGSIYRQRMGTAIGTKFAPASANLFKSNLERNMLSELALKPWFCGNVLDDVFFIWLHGKDTLIKVPIA